MPEIVLTIGQDGKPAGLTEDDDKAYALFRRRLKGMQPGDVLGFSWGEVRAKKVHAAYFKSLSVVFSNQARFDSFNEFREWAERGARHVEIFVSEGVEFERVRSVRHDELDDDEFRILFSRVKAYLLTDRALTHLWPHAPHGAAYEGAHALLEGLQQ